MKDIIAREMTPISLEEEMRSSYLDYAMSVIVGRALPDVRDGLKPVHRRVLYAMSELGNDWNKPYKKSARIVGDVIGKYHPHGDTPIYDTIVRMAQEFSLRYCLVDGQGNFGSVDGDNAAAMRYTEVRMSRIGHTLLEDIDKNTVDFLPNYDGSESEPSVLPAVIPHLLVNGSSGIAVGMATNIPPHRLTEVLAACLHYLDHPDCTVSSLIRCIPAPDFPTAGMIYGLAGIHQAYETGRGRVVIRAKVHVEDVKDKVGQRKALIIDQLPYQVNKKHLLEKIAELVNSKKMEGISDIRDESDKDGIRVVIELKRAENPDIVLNNLYKFTAMQYSFGMNMVALVDGQPRLLNLLEMIHYFIEHRRTVVYRAVLFDLQKARERCHILEGFAVALGRIDPMIALIKASASRQEAHQALLAQLWPADLVRAMLVRVGVNAATFVEGDSVGFVAGGYRLSPAQVKSILDMQLSRLTALEQEKIWTEYEKMVQAILDYEAILADPLRIDAILKEQFARIQKDFGDERRSEIVTTTADLSLEDLLSPHDMVVTFSHAGYIKSQPLSEYRSQKRGGRGKLAASTKDQDCINDLFIANTHDLILCFSSLGRCYWLKVYDVPQGSRTSRGRPIVNLFELKEQENITAMLSVKDFTVEGQYIVMATSRGIIKKTALKDFANPRKGGIIAISLDDDDYLIAAALTDGTSDLMLFSNAGKAVRFSERDVREMGRTARGVRGMQMDESNRIISMLVSAQTPASSVLTVTENGYGKRTPVHEYTRHGRGTKGMIAINQSERNGCVVSAALVFPDDEVMLITELGVLIRVKVNEIREMSRSTQGVLLINLDKGDRLAGVQKIIETVGEEEEEGEV